MADVNLQSTCAAPIGVMIWHPQVLGHILHPEGEGVLDALRVVIVQFTAHRPPLIPLSPGHSMKSLNSEFDCL